MRFFSTRITVWSALLITMLLASCESTPPIAPTVLVLPGDQLSFSKFNEDDAQCRFHASSRLEPKKNATDRKIRNAALGALLGSAVGAAIEDNHKGARAGAALGMLAGMVNDEDGDGEGLSVQQQIFNNTYLQCMYSKGHRVSTHGNMSQNTSAPSE